MRRLAVAFARAAAMPDGRLCTGCVEVLDVTGAGITLMSGDRAGPICVSNDVVQTLEDHQFASGEGPCRDAFDRRLPVLVARMDAGAALDWPFFTDAAVALGVRAVFAYPLSSQGATVGVMTVYQSTAGDLTVRQHDDAVALAEIIGETLLSLQAEAPEGSLAEGLDEAVSYRAQIYQASGMVSVQVGISPADGLARIRAYAFANDLPIDTVAGDIVGRRLRLGDDHDPEQKGA
jgi:hypothetical protein